VIVDCVALSVLCFPRFVFCFELCVSIVSKLGDFVAGLTIIPSVTSVTAFLVAI
jgi:hypothetical protein